MKTLPNTITTIAPAADGAPVTRAGLLQLVMQTAPQGGYSVADMRAAIRVLDVLTTAQPGAELHFEDADYETARVALARFRWGMIHPDIVSLCAAFGL